MNTLAIDAPDLTPAQWEARRWAAVGMSPPEGPRTKRGRPALIEVPRNGKPPRPHRLREDGVKLWRCCEAEHRGVRWLPATEFYRRASARDGLQPRCKRCSRRICEERLARLRAERMEAEIQANQQEQP